MLLRGSLPAIEPWAWVAERPGDTVCGFDGFDGFDGFEGFEEWLFEADNVHSEWLRLS